jgi:hypothetical protein
VSIKTLFLTEWRRDALALFGAFFSCLLAVYISRSVLSTQRRSERLRSHA